MVPTSLLIIDLILNGEALRNYGFREKGKNERELVPVRFNYFILAANCYFIVDAAWGLLYEHRDTWNLFPLLYFLTVFYFIFMLLTMLTWTRYVVAFLEKNGRRSTMLLYGVWAMFFIGIACLMLNRFGHFMFSYNAAHEYIGETGRNISFLLQIAFYFVLTVYMILVANKSSGGMKVRCMTVAVTSIVLGVFLTFQILYALFPFYSIGLMIGICLVHSYVKLGERKEKAIYDTITSAMAEDYEAIFYIEDELNAEKVQKENKKKTVTFGQIAEALA